MGGKVLRAASPAHSPHRHGFRECVLQEMQPGVVGGSGLGGRQDAQVAEWLMAADCKSAAPRSYGGSNPPLCTRNLQGEF